MYLPAQRRSRPKDQQGGIFFDRNRLNPFVPRHHGVLTGKNSILIVILILILVLIVIFVIILVVVFVTIVVGKVGDSNALST